MIVADTNLLFYLLVPGSFTGQAEAVYRKDPDWAAPPLWRSELRNALALYLKRDLLTLNEAGARMQAAETLMGLQEFAVASTRVLTLAAGSGCSAYDCEFVSLAEDLGVPLVTSDQQVLKKFKRTAISPPTFCAR
ncbi:MAG TPA: type II toxin-antitoxin system VapC family toxin [Terriglobia bacterium]|nr:type II toxin-antitoxin system VapC family toxin [Terriglobia bacterium]